MDNNGRTIDRRLSPTLCIKGRLKDMKWTDIRQEEKNSVPVALCIISGYFGYFMQYMNITGQWALSNFAFGMVAFILSFASRMNHHKYSLSAKRTHWIFAGLITFIYIFSLFFRSSDYNLLYFIFYVLLPAYVISGGFRIELVLKTLCLVSIPTVFFYNDIFAISYVGLNQASMGVTYFVLDLIISFVLYFFYYRHNGRWYLVLGYVASFILLIGLVLHGVRGAILSLAILFTLCYINRINSSSNHLENNTQNRKIRIGIVGLVVIIFFYRFETIFEGLYSLASLLLNTIPGFITKMAVYIRSGNIVNGRDAILQDSFKLALKHPLAGVGVGNFGRFFVSSTGLTHTYPHNFLLQLWIECGIIPALIGLVILCTSLKSLLFPKNESKEIIVTIAFFTMLIFPRFLVSLNIWSFTEIWIGLYCLLNIISSHLKEQSGVNDEE